MLQTMLTNCKSMSLNIILILLWIRWVSIWLLGNAPEKKM